MLALDSVAGFDRQRVGLGCKTFKRRESWPIKHQHVVITLTARLREEYYKQMRAGWQTEPVRNQMFLQIKTIFIVNPDTACHQKKTAFCPQLMLLLFVFTGENEDVGRVCFSPL